MTLSLPSQHRTKVEHTFFSPLPIVSSGPPYQMLDLKLALYLPFLKAMEPGVFIAASDTIEVFDTKSLSSISNKMKPSFPRHIVSLRLLRVARVRQSPLVLTIRLNIDLKFDRKI